MTTEEITSEAPLIITTKAPVVLTNEIPIENNSRKSFFRSKTGTKFIRDYNSIIFLLT